MNPAYQLMLISWAAVAVWVAAVIFMNRKVHPKALFALFMVELWERFSYYGMRAILVLYMTSELIKGGFAFDDATAYGIYGAYGALVYLTPILGGVFADRIMGFRTAIIWGALLMAAGQFTLFADNQTTFFIGLALLVIGNGFFKPNISSMIGKFYPDGDPRRDGAFTIFYMGINIGAFLTPLTCGAIGEIEGWKYGFLTAGVGMMLGFGIFMWAQAKGWFESYGFAPQEQKPMLQGLPNKWLPYLTTAVMVPLAWLLIKQNDVVDVGLAVLAILILGYLLFQSTRYEIVQRQRIWVIVILLLFTTVFWTFFELAGSAMNLFTERNVNRNFLGTDIPTTFFQSVNPLFIMLFAPLFSWLWIKLANSGKEPSAPYKFALGLVLLGAGFLVLTLGKGYAVAGLVPAMFLILLYLLHTLGELTLSPVGLSLVTKLSPASIVAFLMGIWFLSSSIAHQAGKHIAKLTTVSEKSIVEDKAFTESLSDAEYKTLFADAAFIGSLDELSIEKALVSPMAIDRLNSESTSWNYFKDSVSVESAEATTTEYFLSRNPKADSTSVTAAPQIQDAEARIQASPTGTIVSSLREQSLSIGLSVFQLLGFVAIGCGIILFLLGPMVSKWMHGIK
jgi:POT family proton-dependent oligopeptide transporter